MKPFVHADYIRVIIVESTQSLHSLFSNMSIFQSLEASPFNESFKCISKYIGVVSREVVFIQHALVYTVGCFACPKDCELNANQIDIPKEEVRNMKAYNIHSAQM